MRLNDTGCKRWPEVCGEIACRQEPNSKICQLANNHEGDHDWGQGRLGTQEKTAAIVRKMLDLANEGKTVAIEQDFGKFTATVCVGDSHTHVGIPGSDGSFEQYVDNLYNALHGGPGLSFA